MAKEERSFGDGVLLALWWVFLIWGMWNFSVMIVDMKKDIDGLRWDLAYETGNSIDYLDRTDDWFLLRIEGIEESLGL